MIGKGKSISHGVAALEYDLAKEINGQAVATEIARHELYGCTGAEMVQEMKPYHIDFPNVKNNCLRFEVSPSIEESATFTDADWAELGNDFMQRMGLANHQYIIIRHSGTESKKEQAHLHILANRVSLSGELYRDNWIGKKATEAANAIAKERNFVQSQDIGKANKAEIKEAMDDVLKKMQGFDLTKFKEELGRRGFKVREARASTGKLNGYYVTARSGTVDAPFNYANGRPVSNWYSSGYRGICSLRDGIRDSLNIIAVKTLTTITPDKGFDYLENFGFTTLVRSEEKNGQIFSDITQSLALGGITYGVTNMELNASYATIANGGTYIKPKLYTKIVDHDGNVVIDNTVGETRQVIKESTAFLLTDAMVDVVTSGTGTSVNFGGMSIAGKTGTTSDYNDVWFAGYTPYYTCTTWTGYDNNAKLSGKTGERNLAKTLWKAAMSKIHENLENKAFNVPADIVTATVCSQSGKLPIAGMCDETLKTEYFAKGTVPTETCDVHYQGSVCEYSGLPATELCPFQVPGTVTMTPALDAALSGNATPAEGSSTQCPHDAAFMADPNAAAVIAQQRLELDARNMLANYDIQMANLQAALQNAQTVLASAQQQFAAAADPESQAAAQNSVNQAQQEIDSLNAQIAALQNAYALQQQQAAEQGGAAQ